MLWEKVERAVRLLQRLRDHPVSILLSGGKDSVAVLLLCLEARLKQFNIVYTEVTGNTHPECTRYVIRLCEELGVRDRLVITRRDDKDFFQCILEWGIPYHHSRWCMDKFKVQVWRRVCYPTTVTGMKRGDSVLRTKYIRPIFKHRNLRWWVVCPLHDWTTEEVLDFIKSMGVEVNPLYERYGHSGNCMFCAFFNLSQKARVMMDPEWGPKIAEVLQRWYERYGRTNTAHRHALRVYHEYMRFYRQSSILQYLGTT